METSRKNLLLAYKIRLVLESEPEGLSFRELREKIHVRRADLFKVLNQLYGAGQISKLTDNRLCKNGSYRFQRIFFLKSLPNRPWMRNTQPVFKAPKKRFKSPNPQSSSDTENPPSKSGSDVLFMKL